LPSNFLFDLSSSKILLLKRLLGLVRGVARTADPVVPSIVLS
jgi:hypothetical protein